MTPAYLAKPCPTYLTEAGRPLGRAWPSAGRGTSPTRLWEVLLVREVLLDATVPMLPLNMPECTHHCVIIATVLSLPTGIHHDHFQSVIIYITARAQTRDAEHTGFIVLWALATLPFLPTALMNIVCPTTSTTTIHWAQRTA